MSTSIKEILYEKRLSQSWLARECRIPQSNMNLIANQKLIPCPAWRKRISEVLDVPESVLFPSQTLEVK